MTRSGYSICMLESVVRRGEGVLSRKSKESKGVGDGLSKGL